jgi:hypothetical protein
MDFSYPIFMEFSKWECIKGVHKNDKRRPFNLLFYGFPNAPYITDKKLALLLKSHKFLRINQWIETLFPSKSLSHEGL